jgi:Zn finger protein HypA/HybF involved in hydrogenase expression
MSEPNEPTLYCEACQQHLNEDEWGSHEEMCNTCYEGAVEAVNYREWVNRGG